MNNTLKTYILENEFLKIKVLNLGGAILSFEVKNGNETLDIALGHRELDDYILNPGNLGVIVGRNANRIENATVDINNIRYDLEVNHFHNNLHTGSKGLQYTYFDVEEKDSELILSTTVKHLSDGFPGNLELKVHYILNDHTFTIKYDAVSDEDTIVNITNHSYFNLNGQDASNIYNHNLKINSDFYMPNNEFSMPIKSILESKDTSFDFKDSKNIETCLSSQDDQIKNFAGLDHNFLINNSSDDFVARIENGNISMTIHSDVNAMHIYTSNHFPELSTLNKSEKHYPLHGGIAFETQISPNSMMMPWMKSPLLKKGEHFKSYTSFTIE